MLHVPEAGIAGAVVWAGVGCGVVLVGVGAGAGGVLASVLGADGPGTATEATGVAAAGCWSGAGSGD